MRISSHAPNCVCPHNVKMSELEWKFCTCPVALQIYHQWRSAFKKKTKKQNKDMVIFQSELLIRSIPLGCIKKNTSTTTDLNWGNNRLNPFPINHHSFFHIYLKTVIYTHQNKRFLFLPQNPVDSLSRFIAFHGSGYFLLFSCVSCTLVAKNQSHKLPPTVFYLTKQPST